MHRLADKSSLFESAFVNAPIGMAIADLEGRRVRVNDAFCRLVGRSAAELAGTEVSEATHPDDRRVDLRDRERLRSGEIASYQVEKRYRHAWGHYVWTLVTVSLIRDTDGEPLFFISQVQDITQRKAHESRLEAIVNQDFLTGLSNRRHFERVLKDELQRTRRYDHSGAMLLIDLDHFKDINDTFGHACGDDVLKHVATTLRDRVRGTDTLARLGGDEFAVILPHANRSQAQYIAESIVRTLRRRSVVLGDRDAYVGASVGVFCFGDSTPEQAMANADMALYEAKRAGRSRVAVFASDEATPTERTSSLEEIRDERLCLFCQPIVDLSADTVTQYELLLRVRDAPGGVPGLPAAFLKAAERDGFISSVDGWVTRQAVGLLARAARNVALNVNVSAKAIGDPQFAALVEDALNERPIDPSRLVFELSEAVAVSDLHQARRFAQHMQELGCRIALDDFGAGFSSFQHLKYLPFDMLKIDGEFVRDLATGVVDQLVVNAVVGISAEMGKKTVAECVESADMSRLLKQSGVDFAQGYYFSRPTSVDEVFSAA